MRLVPRSLFGRLALVLAVGLVIAQLLSAVVNLAERDRLLIRSSGMQPAQRIADVVRLLDSSSAPERARLVSILSVPPLRVSLDQPVLPESDRSVGPHGAMFAAVLRSALGDDRPMKVAVRGTPPSWPVARGAQHPAMGGPGMGPGMHRFAPDGLSFVAQVRLQDGTWATFDAEITREEASLPWRLLLTLGIVLATVLLLSYVAVRWITRPLHVLAVAADELGRDIHRPPLSENGPVEVSRAARAFNAMQARLVAVFEERTRILAAMSHDLKTPITRMRLRAEMLDDEQLREKFDKDLVEMQTMVDEALDYMRGLSERAPEEPVDVMAMLQGLRQDYTEMGKTVTVQGHTAKRWRGVPQLLRRCLGNLVDNAIAYGTRADLSVEEGGAELVIHVRDRGPGIPEAELDKVFEPFYRVEGSRSRTTGGTGLGLSIARNIARAHGGDVRLYNLEEGGIDAVLTLP